MSDLTVVILTCNEEAVIERCIRSIKFPAQVMVLDSGSNDKTRELASAAGALVVESPWPGDFAAQRNAGNGFVSTEWVLYLDADEVISEEMGAKIEAFFSSDRKDAFAVGRFPRRELMFGKWIRHGGWYPQYKLRLYRKGIGRWEGRVHERFEYQGEAYDFDGDILHDSYRDISTFLDKFNRYSSIEAEERYRNGKRFNLAKLLFQSVERFLGRFFIHKGYRDGFHGFILALLIVVNYVMIHLKLWEIEYAEKKQNLLS